MTAHLLQPLREISFSNRAFREVKTDSGLTVLQGVLLLRSGPGNLEDRHWYSRECIEDAGSTGVFDGAQAYLDHPSSWEEQVQPGRSVEKLAGYYSDSVARAYDDPELGPSLGLFADFHPEVGKPQVLSILRTCVEYASRFPGRAYAGLSIFAMGDSLPVTIDGEEWYRVDRISEGRSVDIVTRAGAGGTLVPLKESYFGMKTQKNKGNATTGDVRLTIDADGVKEGVKKILEGASTRLMESIKGLTVKDGKVELTKEQEAQILKNVLPLAEVDKAFDDNTSVEDEIPMEAAAATDDPDDAGDVDDLPDDAKVLKGKLKGAIKAKKTAEAALATASERVNEAETRASAVSRDRLAENVLSKLEIPETYRPRIMLEIRQMGYSREREMLEHAQAFDKAFIRPTDSAGNVTGNGGSAALATGGNFDFNEEA